MHYLTDQKIRSDLNDIKIERNDHTTMKIRVGRVLWAACHCYCLRLSCSYGNFSILGRNSHWMFGYHILAECSIRICFIRCVGRRLLNKVFKSCTSDVIINLSSIHFPRRNYILRIKSKSSFGNNL